MAAELSYADRRTDMKKQLVAFRNFANALNNIYCKSWIKNDKTWNISEKTFYPYTKTLRWMST